MIVESMSSRIRQTETGIAALRDRLNTTIRGKADVLEMVLVCLLSRGHLLLEDRPGLGKTTLAKCLAQGIGGQFARIQCTPDLLPSDITGFNILNQKSLEFEFRQGPVFSDVLLADEINRATPRTQSALLEAMAERQVTIDGKRYPLCDEFFLIATQNPSETHGTYPLPEAQLDRFAMKLQLGYPHSQDEVDLLRADLVRSQKHEDIPPALKQGELAALQQSVTRITVAESLQNYLVGIAAATRNHPGISLGISPRGLLTWQRAAQAYAFLHHRNYVTPDDIQQIARPILSVRLATESQQMETIIQDILETVPVPNRR